MKYLAIFFLLCVVGDACFGINFNQRIEIKPIVLPYNPRVVRVKDIANFEGIRDNLLIGYGLVVGLNGTGDNLRNSAFTQQELEDFFSRVGVNTKGSNLRTKNAAAVTITATLPPFSRQGNRVDVNVSAIGDAKSLENGTLIATPLLGADGEVYAVAQGFVSLNGVKQNTDSITRSHSFKTGGMISGGAIVEKEVDFKLNSLGSINIALRNPDISTSTQIAKAINDVVCNICAEAIDPGTVRLKIPKNHNVMEILTAVEQIKINPDYTAKIVINEKSGTIVMNKDVKVSAVAIAQGNLLIHIDDEGDISNKVALVKRKDSLQDLVRGLNLLGVTPRDLIDILQNMRAAGAIQADVVVE